MTRASSIASGSGSDTAALKVSVVLVTYNAVTFVRRCLSALAQHTASVPCEIVAVDNDSRDGTPQMIESDFPNVKLLRNRENVGFARACNQAFAATIGPYILWLNTDCFLMNDAVEQMAAYLDTHSDAGIVGPRLFNEDGSYQPSCRHFLSASTEFVGALPLVNKLPISEIQATVAAARTASDAIAVPFVSGACLMFRRNLYVQLGGLDERFFMYCEEEDFCRRAAAAGWKTMYLPGANAMHVGGGSAPTFDRCLRLYASKVLYYRKHHSRAATWMFRITMGLALSIRLLVGLAAALFPPKSKTGKALATEGAAGICVMVGRFRGPSSKQWAL